MYVRHLITDPDSTKEFTRTYSEMLVHSRNELEFENAGFLGEGNLR